MAVRRKSRQAIIHICQALSVCLRCVSSEARQREIKVLISN